MSSSSKKRRLQIPDYCDRYVKTGKVLIINNKHFWDGEHDTRTTQELENDEKSGTRHGSEADVQNLKDTLGKYGFKIEDRNLVTDKTKEEITDAVKEFASEVENDPNCDMILVVVMTHGNENGILSDKYWNFYYVNNVWDAFTSPNLEDIPKVFIFQACRGEEKDEGIPTSHFCQASTSSGQQEPSKSIQPVVEADNDGKVTYLPSNESFPNMWNTLVCYATVPDYVSYRASVDGSYFLSNLISCMNEQDSFELKDILTKANNRLTNAFIGVDVLDEKGTSLHVEERKQTSMYCSSLTYKLFLEKKQ